MRSVLCSMLKSKNITLCSLRIDFFGDSWYNEFKKPPNALKMGVWGFLCY